MLSHRPPAGTAPHRAFTMIELIVILVILGVLAASSAVAFTAVTDRSRTKVAQQDLRTIGTQMLTQAALTSTALTRNIALDAIAGTTGHSVLDGLAAADVRVLGATDTPAEGEYAVGFDNGDGATTDTGGRRAALLTTARGTTFAYVFSNDTLTAEEVRAEAGATPASVLVGTLPPAPSPTPSTTPAPTPPPAPACTAVYSTVHSWPGGYQGNVIVTATGAPLTSWAVRWTQPADTTPNGTWAGLLSQSGPVVTVVNESWNGWVSTTSTASFGFNANGPTPAAPLMMSCTGS